MSVHVLLNLLYELGRANKCKACQAFYCFFATSLINSIIQELQCQDSIYHMTSKLINIIFLA